VNTTKNQSKKVSAPDNALQKLADSDQPITTMPLSLRNQVYELRKSKKVVRDLTTARRNSVISAIEFETLSLLYPLVPTATYQAGTGEYFVAEYSNGRLARLVHYFSPIL